MAEGDDREQSDEHQAAIDQTAEKRLTRKRVADSLGVSVFKVRSMEGTVLHPVREGGVHYFDPEEVAKTARALGPRRRRPAERTEGEIAAIAFRAFSEGKDLREVVDELEASPEKVRALYREWREPDLEEHELKRHRRERAHAEQRRDDEAQRQHERQMAQLERQLSQLNK